MVDSTDGMLANILDIISDIACFGSVDNPDMKLPIIVETDPAASSNVSKKSPIVFKSMLPMTVDTTSPILANPPLNMVATRLAAIDNVLNIGVPAPNVLNRYENPLWTLFMIGNNIVSIICRRFNNDWSKLAASVLEFCNWSAWSSLAFLSASALLASGAKAPCMYRKFSFPWFLADPICMRCTSVKFAPAFPAATSASFIFSIEPGTLLPTSRMILCKSYPAALAACVTFWAASVWAIPPTASISLRPAVTDSAPILLSCSILALKSALLFSSIASIAIRILASRAAAWLALSISPRCKPVALANLSNSRLYADTPSA